jgi:hypothetical protein
MFISNSVSTRDTNCFVFELGYFKLKTNTIFYNEVLPYWVDIIGVNTKLPHVTTGVMRIPYA